MEITIKESMLIRKCINDYVLENKLDYDKSPLFNNLMTTLKKFENVQCFRKGYETYKEYKQSKKSGVVSMNSELYMALEEFPKWMTLSELQEAIRDDERSELKKELKKYSIQTTCNEKILELMESENKMKEKTINKSLLSKISKNDIIELMMLNKKGDK